MKKPMPPKSTRKNGKGPATLPELLTPVVAQAVLEDAVLEAAADNAAISATLGTVATDIAVEPLVATIVPETPEEAKILELVGVPYLGSTRARALADAGICTLADLRAATPGQIGGVKGVGLRNAERIKEWLTTQPDVDDAPVLLSVPNVPPAATASLDPVLAAANNSIYAELGAVDQAITRLTEKLRPKDQSKKLLRQFEKVGSVTSELAEGPDTLGAKRVQQAVKVLNGLTALLEAAAGEKRLSEKKQEALCEKLRDQRRMLQKLIGD